MPASVEEVAYEASVRAIDRQYEALVGLRAQSATILAAAALVASFVGPEAIRANAGSLGGWVTVGVAALVVVMVLVLAVLWPRSFIFRLGATVILEDHAGKPASSVTELFDFLARRQDEHHETNERVLDQLRLYGRLASAAVVVETVALLLAL